MSTHFLSHWRDRVSDHQILTILWSNVRTNEICGNCQSWFGIRANLGPIHEGMSIFPHIFEKQSVPIVVFSCSPQLSIACRLIRVLFTYFDRIQLTAVAYLSLAELSKVGLANGTLSKHNLNLCPFLWMNAFPCFLQVHYILLSFRWISWKDFQ